MDLVKGCACGGGCGEEPHSAHWAPRSASCPRLLSTRCSARCIVLGTSLARLVRPARFNVKMLGYSVTLLTLLRPIKFDPDPAPPYRHRVLGGKIKVFEQIYSRSSVVTSGDRSSRGASARASPRPPQRAGTTQHDAAPCSPVPLEPSTAIVLKKKSVRRTVRDEPGRRHRIPLHKQCS